MIDVIVADHQEPFHVGMAEILASTDDVFLIVQPRSPDQLLKALQTVIPHVLVLSTTFLPAFSKIQPMLQRRTALLLLAEENDDRASYVRWLQAQGIVYRSMDGPVIIEAIRRVARGELFVQDRSSDMRENQSEGA